MPARIVALVLATVLAGVAPADASDALWDLLRAGGQIVLLRHAATDRSIGDPPNFRVDDCATQRNLSPEGRAQAERIGAAFRARGVPIGRVLSSQWCRCLDTARLAFGEVEPWPALNSAFARREASRTREVQAMLAQPPARGNVVLVTHQVNIRDATGEGPSEGEAVVVTPLGQGRFTVAGRLAAGEAPR